MKIACVGNMNNGFFSIVRYLRDRDYDAELFLLKREFAHFLPSHDSHDDSYKKFTHFLAWGNLIDFLFVSRKKIREQFNQYDKVICCGWTIAYLQSAGVKIDLFIPYGSDLYKYPFFDFSSRWFFVNHLSYFQKRGILSCKNVMFEWPNEIFQNSLNKIGYSNNIVKSQMPMLYEPEYSNSDESVVNNEWLSKIKKIRDTSDIIVFHQTRHGWLDERDPISLKGNDKLIHGIKLLCERHPHIKCTLVTFEYGTDVNNSKRLIEKLGIKDSVMWLPLMSRRELLYLIRFADIVAGEFHLSWLTYGVVIEALMSKKIVMQYRNDELYSEYYDELYPLMNVKTEEEICSAIESFLKDKEKYIKMANEGYQWYRKYCVELPLENIIKSLHE